MRIEVPGWKEYSAGELARIREREDHKIADDPKETPGEETAKTEEPAVDYDKHYAELSLLETNRVSVARSRGSLNLSPSVTK